MCAICWSLVCHQGQYTRYNFITNVNVHDCLFCVRVHMRYERTSFVHIGLNGVLVGFWFDFVALLRLIYLISYFSLCLFSSSLIFTLLTRSFSGLKADILDLCALGHSDSDKNWSQFNKYVYMCVQSNDVRRRNPLYFSSVKSRPVLWNANHTFSNTMANSKNIIELRIWL